LQKELQTIICPEGFEVCVVDGKGRGLFAKSEMQAGHRICVCTGYPIDITRATAMCLQIDENVFLQGTGEFDDYFNHSCDPNCFIRYEGQTPVMYVLKDLKKGDELTFDYNTSDWDLIEQGDSNNCDLTFSCRCGTDMCVGEIKGFRYLTAPQRAQRKECLSPFLLSKFHHP